MDRLTTSHRESRKTYHLPRWPLTPARVRSAVRFGAIGVLCAVGSLALLVVGLLNAWELAVLIPSVGLPALAALVLFLDVCNQLTAIPFISTEGDRLRFGAGLLGRWIPRERSISEMIGFVVHPLSDERAALEGFDDPGVLEVVSRDRPPLWIGEGYRRDLLRDLADRLSRRCWQTSRVNAPVSDGPPIALRKLDALNALQVFDEDLRDVKSRPDDTRWELTRREDEVQFRLPPSRTVGFRLLTAILIFAGMGVWILFATVPSLRLPGMSIGVLSLLVGGGLSVFAFHRASLERRLELRDGRLTWVERNRIVLRKRPQECKATDIRAVRASRVIGKQRFFWTLLICTANGVNHSVYLSRNGDEIRWLATVLRSALDVPSLPRPEAEAHPIPLSC